MVSNPELFEKENEHQDWDVRKNLPVYARFGFNAYALNFFYRLKGTCFVYYTSRNIWLYDQEGFSGAIKPTSFEEVFSRIMEDGLIQNEIKEEIIFHLDELRAMEDESAGYVKKT